MNPDESALQDWRDLENIKEGVNLIFALPATAHIGIIVDSDVDGFTSASIIGQYLSRYLPSLGITYYIHDGKAHGLEELEMTFTAVSRLVGLSWHQVTAICKRYVDLGLEQADFSEVKRLAADETSEARGHDYITLVADADERRVLFVTEARRPRRSRNSLRISPSMAAIPRPSNRFPSTCPKPSSKA